MMWRMTFNNSVVIEMTIPGSTESDVREQIEYEVAQGWHSGVDASNTFTIEEI